MSQPLDQLVADNLDIWTSVTERKSGAGRSGGGKRVNLYGIKRLRALILDLAVRGKLVPQDARGEPAAALLPKIAAERQRRIKAKEIKVAKGPSKPTSEPFELPSGWVWLPLWQTGNIFTGNSINPALRVELEKNGEGRPFVATKDVGYGFDPIDYDNGLTVDLEDQRFSVAKPNSVFICAEGGSAGRKMAISDREISFGNKLIANEPWSQIEPRYILYTYLSDFFFDSFSKEMTGIIGGISRAKFLALPFPLPPLAEQRRIVVKVDELMALCDALERESADALAAHQALVENLLATLVDSADAVDLAAAWARLESHFDTLFTTDASIETLKQTILDLAVRGKLVEQHAVDEPAHELLKRIRRSNAQRVSAGNSKKMRTASSAGIQPAPFPLPEGWQWTDLAAIAYKLTDGAHHTPSYQKEGVPFLSVKDMSNGSLGFADTRFISEREHAELYKRCDPERGDLLITKVGTTGVPVIVDTDEPFSLFVSVALLKADWTLIDVHYLKLLVESPFVRRQSAEGTQGIGNKNLVLRTIAAFEIPFPPLAEQHRIVAKVDELMALCDALKARIADAAATQRHLADAVVERAAA